MYITLNYATFEALPFVNVQAVAEYHGFTAETVREKLRQSSLKSIRIGDIRIDKVRPIQSKKRQEFINRIKNKQSNDTQL